MMDQCTQPSERVENAGLNVRHCDFITMRALSPRVITDQLNHERIALCCINRHT